MLITLALGLSMKSDVFLAVLAQDAIQRHGLVSFLEAGGFTKVQSFDDVQTLQAASLPENTRVLFLLDCQKALQSADQLQALRAARPNSLLVLLANEYRESFLWQAVRLSADGLLLSRIGPEVLIKSLELVLLGERVFPIKTFLTLNQTGLGMGRSDGCGVDAREVLSAREIEVLRRLTAGHPNKVIARDCGITESTVKVHVKAILRKIQAKNRTQAAVWARRHGVSETISVTHEEPIAISGPGLAHLEGSPRITKVGH